jgi:hypothetical protein
MSLRQRAFQQSSMFENGALDLILGASTTYAAGGGKNFLPTGKFFPGKLLKNKEKTSPGFPRRPVEWVRRRAAAVRGATSGGEFFYGLCT